MAVNPCLPQLPQIRLPQHIWHGHTGYCIPMRDRAFNRLSVAVQHGDRAFFRRFERLPGRFDRVLDVCAGFGRVGGMIPIRKGP
jgi:hypothetical protein